MTSELWPRLNLFSKRREPPTLKPTLHIQILTNDSDVLDEKSEVFSFIYVPLHRNSSVDNSTGAVMHVT
jgi:hypothetical protein